VATWNPNQVAEHQVAASALVGQGQGVQAPVVRGKACQSLRTLKGTSFRQISPPKNSTSLSNSLGNQGNWRM
jgi:hypothetical protein